jgi:chorismate mutase
MPRTLGLRGATTSDANTADAILDATEELLNALVAANGLAEGDVGAVFFTTTADLDAEFPAKAARVRLGWQDTALMDGQEIPVPGAPESVIRILLLLNTDKRKEDLNHVYLRGALGLRATSKGK